MSDQELLLYSLCHVFISSASFPSFLLPSLLPSLLFLLTIAGSPGGKAGASSESMRAKPC